MIFVFGGLYLANYLFGDIDNFYKIFNEYLVAFSIITLYELIRDAIKNEYKYGLRFIVKAFKPLYSLPVMIPLQIPFIKTFLAEHNFLTAFILFYICYLIEISDYYKKENKESDEEYKKKSDKKDE